MILELLMNFDEIPLKCKIAVVGAGPAGLVTALKLSEKGYKDIVLLDKRDPWREPVACAEAVHKVGLAKVVDIGEGWIRSDVDGVDFYSPNGTKVRYKKENSGVILDRGKMHYDLALRCQKAGVKCHFKTLVKEITEVEESIRRVHYTQEGEVKSIEAEMIVEASGAAKFLSKSDTVLDNEHMDVEPAVFALVEGIPYDEKYIAMYYGEAYAPGGYAWVFPRGDGVANVGVVCDRAHVKSHPPRKMLKQLVERFWPDATIGVLHGGPIPCGQNKAQIATEALFRVGDAADMVNPLSRAGILEAMFAGQFASEAIDRYFKEDASKRDEIFAEYFEKWWDKKGHEHFQFQKAKMPFGSISDKALDRAAMKLAKIPQEKMTMFRILWATVSSAPSLIWKMRGLYFKPK
jgi:digeranylgeranylglycerophospholipid reductase